LKKTVRKSNLQKLMSITNLQILQIHEKPNLQYLQIHEKPTRDEPGGKN